MRSEQAWQKEEHSRIFGKAIRANNKFLFTLKYQRSLPSRCMNYLLSASGGSGSSVLDIGCAAGDMYAYLACLPIFSQLTYRGLDISKPAIEHANRSFETDVFGVINGDEDLRDKEADIVLSVDVVLHQLQPFEHISNILGCARKYLVVALRTRDEGETVLDPELSCQRNYGEWVPWIVVNMKELYRTIITSSASHLRITSFKEYTIFGGEGRRYLPKDLYLEDSKTALSTLVIEKCEDLLESEITEYLYESRPAISYKKWLFYSYLGAGLKKLGLDEYVARISCERVENIGEILKHTQILDIRRVDLN